MNGFLGEGVKMYLHRRKCGIVLYNHVRLNPLRTKCNVWMTEIYLRYEGFTQVQSLVLSFIICYLLPGTKLICDALYASNEVFVRELKTIQSFLASRF